MKCRFSLSPSEKCWVIQREQVMGRQYQHMGKISSQLMLMRRGWVLRLEEGAGDLPQQEHAQDVTLEMTFPSAE